MKNLTKFLTVFLLVLLGANLQQAWGDNAGLWSENVCQIRYYTGGESDKNYDHKLSGVSTKDLGSGTTFYFKGWTIKTWKNDNGNICGGDLWYRFYKDGSTAPSYTQSARDNDWSESKNPKFYKDLNINLLDGKEGGVYYLEYYFKATGNKSSNSGCGDEFWGNNGTSGGSYKIQFKYTKSYTVTLDAAGGTINAGNVTSYVYGTGATLPTNVTKTGYTFDGWYDGNTKVTSISNTTTGDKSYTAKWTAKTYNLTIVGNYPNSTYSYARTVKYDAQSFTIEQANRPTRTGYTLQGYYKEAACTEAIAGIGGALKKSTSYTNADGKWSYDATSTVTLYAGWTANTYRVYLNKGGSSSGVSQVTATYDADMPSATAPSLTGYDFAGYYDGQNGTGTKYYNNDMSSAHIWDKAEADVTLYAYYTPKSYTVTLEQTSATTQGATSATVYYNTVPTQVTSLPTRTGYTFGGYNTNTSLLLVNAQGEWQASVDGFTDADGKWIKTTGATLSPIWNPITTTVTLKANGGTGDDQTFDVVFDGDINTTGKTAHTRTGYDLKGYFTATTNGSKILEANLAVRSGSSAIDGWLNASNKWKNPNTTADLFAQWTAHQWTITLNDNEGTGGSGTKTATYGTTTSITSVKVPTRENHSFAGYYNDQAGEGVQVYDVNGKLLANATGYTDASSNWIYDNNVTLYAKWNSAGNYVITLDNLDATNPGTTSVNVQINTTTGLTENITCPTKTGYTFGGYFTATGGGGTQLINADGSWIKPAEGYIDSDGKWIKNDNVTLKAKWDANKTTVSLDQQSGTGGTTQRTLDYNSTQNLENITLPTRVGYTFGGYFTSTNGEGTQLISAEGAWIADVVGYTETSGDKIKWIKTTTDPLTLYAKWTPITYTITYAGNGNTGGSTENSTHTYDAAKNLTTNGFTRAYTVTYDYQGATDGNSEASAVANYTFANWTCSANEDTYTDGASVTNLASTQDAVVTMTAQWTSASVTLPTPVKTGYSFDGWYNNADRIGGAGDSYTPEANVTLTAQWTEIMSALSTAVNAMGTTAGQSAPTATVNQIGVTTTASITASAAKAGYTFEGWTLTNCKRTDSNGDKSLTITVKGLGNAEAATVTANYAEDLSTDWQLNFSHDGWHLYDFVKETGQSTGTIAYYSIDLEIDKSYEFEIRKKSSNTYYKNTGTMTATNCTDWSFTTSADKRAWLNTSVAGIYKFKIDFSGDNPKISVIYPDITCIQGDFDGWSRTEHAISEANNWTTIVNITDDNANKTLKFRLVWHGAYYSNTGTMTSTNCTGWTFAPNQTDNYCQITTTVAGDYTFSLNTSDMKLSVSYPGENSRMVIVDNGETQKDVEVKEVTETPLVASQYLNGMRFNGWVVTNSEGVVQENKITINHPENYSTHMHGAKADGLIVKATYTSHGIIYFKNNPGWSEVVVYFYSKDYFNPTNGTGAVLHYDDSGNDETIAIGYHMTHLANTDIWYYDWLTPNHARGSLYVAFSDQLQNKNRWFHKCQVAYRGDWHDEAPLFVIRNYINTHRNESAYYEEGLWMKYNSTESGYDIRGQWGSWAKADNQYFTATSPGGYEFTSGPIALPGNTENEQFIVYLAPKGISESYFAEYGTMIGKGNKITPSQPYTRVYDKKTSSMDNGYIQTTAGADYIFKLSLGDGQIIVSVEYPLSEGDYQVVSVTNGKAHSNGIIYKQGADASLASFFIEKGKTTALKLQKCSTFVDNKPVWEDIDVTYAIPQTMETGIYNFRINPLATNPTIENLNQKYSGKYYIRTDGLDGGWESYQTNADNEMYDYGSMLDAGDTYENFPYDYYKTKWIQKDKNVKFTIANDYSKCISDSLVGDAIIGDEVMTLPEKANVRFMWNSENNTLKRAYLSGSTNTEDRYLVLTGDEKMFFANGNIIGEGTAEDHRKGLHANELNFKDNNNWVYQVDLKAKPGCGVNLTAKYNNSVQDFIGTAANHKTIISGTGNEAYSMRAVYDFKTNILVAGWVPDGTPITSKIVLGGDILLTRTHQDDAQQIRFGTDGSIEDIHHVYSVLTIKKNVMLGQNESGYTKAATNADYERTMYWISFPFDVKISEVFGVDGYGKKWIMQRYNGEKRAEIGWFQETETFWEYLAPTSTLQAYKGYLLILNANYFNTDGADVWKNSATEANFYFPSAEKNIGIINKSSVEIEVHAHECKINRPFADDPEKNHKITDSYWNVIGVPAFQDAPAGATPVDGGLNAYYEWVSSDNTYKASVVMDGVTFKTMHAYMVQFGGKLTWSNVSVVSKAPYAYADSKNYMIELFFNGNGAEDHTYVKLADGAHTDFVLNEDMMKIDNAGFPNIYSFAGAYDVAYNETKMIDQVVTIGVSAPADGSYTFSMPKDFSGSAILVDLEEGTATDLNVSNYTVELNKGTYNNRFQLMLKVEASTPTNIDNVDGGEWNADGKTKKLFINDNIYLINAGRIYNVLGVEE